MTLEDWKKYYEVRTYMRQKFADVKELNWDIVLEISHEDNVMPPKKIKVPLNKFIAFLEILN